MRTFLLICMVLGSAGCYRPVNVHPDASVDAGDGDGDGDRDAGPDADADAGDADRPWPTHDSDIETPEDVPDCGDGNLDPGEECDDGNRLNGDGCDWLCRAWDGERPPEPDPDIGDYVPEGDPVTVHASPDPESDNIIYLPLEWTGTALATAFQESVSTGFPMQVQVRFRRFAPDGTTLSPEFTHRLHSNAYALGIDLVWTGDGFGFFFSDTDVGIYYLWLDEEMKPDGDPVLVVEAPRVGALAADVSGDGFVLAWMVFTDREGPTCYDLADDTSIAETWVRLVDREGSTAGLAGPLLVDDTVDWHASPDVVTTGDGFALLTFPAATFEQPRCRARVVELSRTDLTTTASTGSLSPSSGGELIFDGTRTVVSWSNEDGRRETTDAAICTVGLAAGARLEGPPVCEVPSTGESIVRLGPTRFATDGRGFLHVFDGMLGMTYPTDARLWALRGDPLGTPVGSVRLLATEPVGHVVERTDDGFGVLYVRGGDGITGELLYQRFVPAD